MRILITGLGSTGKSNFRNFLVNILSLSNIEAEGIDFDYQAPKKFEDKFYIIEDVRGLIPDKWLISPFEYDVIFYIKPTFISNALFWIRRGYAWWQTGKMDWKRERGWRGNNKPKSLRNCAPIVKEILRRLRNLKKWLREDMEMLSKLKEGGKKVLIIQSRWKKGGIKFILPSGVEVVTKFSHLP